MNYKMLEYDRIDISEGIDIHHIKMDNATYYQRNREKNTK